MDVGAVERGAHTTVGGAERGQRLLAGRRAGERELVRVDLIAGDPERGEVRAVERDDRSTRHRAARDECRVGARTVGRGSPDHDVVVGAAKRRKEHAVISLAMRRRHPQSAF